MWWNDFKDVLQAWSALANMKELSHGKQIWSLRLVGVVEWGYKKVQNLYWVSLGEWNPWSSDGMDHVHLILVLTVSPVVDIPLLALWWTPWHVVSGGVGLWKKSLMCCYFPYSNITVDSLCFWSLNKLLKLILLHHLSNGGEVLKEFDIFLSKCAYKIAVDLLFT